MLKHITDSAPASIIVDDTPETPALAIGSTMFWKDGDGYWQTVEVIDCEPIGWGFCCIKWHTPSGWHTRSLPVIQLVDLDTYLEQQDDYGRFEADDNDTAFDEYHDRQAIIRLGYGG
jgi:hypothetical protein